jgi:Ca-activated chloride channel homolog
MSAKGADARRQTQKHDHRPLRGVPDPAPVFHVLLVSGFRWKRTAVILLLAAAVSLLTAARQNPYKISDHVNLVLLDVSVKDPHGGFVTGLHRNNFQVYDDGRPREIANFADADTPVTIGLVNDESGSMRSKRPEVVTAGLAFAKESNLQDQFFVVNFNDRAYFGLPQNVNFTDRLPVLRAGLYFGTPSGQTALYDAVAMALKHIELSSRDKRTLIVVSDGGDNVSRIKFHELLRMLDASQVTIYTVGLMDPFNHDLNPKVLRKLASVSGGEYFQPQRLDQVLPTFHHISQDVRSRYTLGFSPDLSDGKHGIHNIKVNVFDQSGHKLIARTRSSYSTELFDQLLAKEGK